MDELSNFFNFSGPSTSKVHLEGAETGGKLILTKEEIEEMKECDRTPYRTIETDIDYVDYYRKKEQEEELRLLNEPEYVNAMDALDDVTSLGDMVSALDLIEDKLFYNKHEFKHKPQPNLTINSEKENILATIASNSITIIEGPTGCGKTTQVPQWILESQFENRKYCNIVVTQPRRIAAMSIAKRVCDENGLKVGGIVGYQVALDSMVSQDTRLHYVTTGVLLQKLVATRSLEKYTHIILDEVHERNQDMDFLFIVVKKLLRKAKGVKVVLMSATFNTEVFGQYFRPDMDTLAPTITVETENNYKISIFYLSSLSTLGKLPEVSYNEPKISNDMYLFALKILNAFEDIDIAEEVPYSRPSVLIFLPGLHEIEQLYNNLNDHRLRESAGPEKANMKWWLIPLHSTITTEEQVRVFRQPPADHRKIILATNIAESSITVPDIKYVIDFCLSKTLMFKRETNFSSLQLTWASRANCKQRAGRTGRVRDGRVYRLVPEEFYFQLPKDCIPEIQRSPLDNLVLSAKLLDMGSPVSLLALAMDPPDLSDICRTMSNLKQVGALLKTVDGQNAIEDGDITFIGQIMAKLPLDIRISKLIVLGYVFGCTEECIIMAGGMSVRNVFSTPFQERMTAYSTKLTWADGSSSDCLALLGVYKTYQHLCKHKYFANNQNSERGWAKRLFLQITALHEMDSLIKELKFRLSNDGILDMPKQKLWTESEIPLILKLLIAGAFYPYYFTFSNGGDSEEREAAKILGGRDPRNTVYYTNMDLHQPVQLYAASIKQQLKDCSKEDIIVSSDGSGSKVYVTFQSQDRMVQGGINEKCSFIPGKVVLPVYKAVKMRQLKFKTVVNLLSKQKASEYANSLGIPPQGNFVELCTDSNDYQTSPLIPRLPDIDENYIDIILTHIIDCGHFWAQYADDSSQNKLRWIEKTLSTPGNLEPLQTPPEFGVMYAAPYQETPNSPIAFYRVKVTNVLQDGRVAISYIDYGNGGVIKSSSLQTIVGEHAQSITSFKALAIECILTEVGPSLALDSRGLWTNEAIHIFVNLTRKKKLLAKVYSVAHCIVSLTLTLDNRNINDFLIERGYAIPAEESYASKENRALRDSSQNFQPSQKLALNRQQAKKFASSSMSSNMYVSPNPRECVRTVTLSGPHSPLETKLHNLMYAGKDKSIAVQWDSVNSVILNSDPQYPCERLLVAAHVDQSSSGDNVTLRSTTLLPNIPGLPALVALIFCPTAELHPDLTQTKYSAVLCGLGHIDGQPLYPEHDILVNIDVDLDNEDLGHINKLRLFMDTMLATQGSQMAPVSSEEVKASSRENIKALLGKIILKKRKYREPGSLKKPWQWNMNFDDMKVEAKNFMPLRAIFPPHDALLLRKLGENVLMKLAEANHNLYQMCNSVLLAGNNKVECVLCKTDPLLVTTMRVHLNSRLHKEREAELPQYIAEPKLT